MSKKTTAVFPYKNLNILGGDDFYIFEFKESPGIKKEPVVLKGGTIQPGDKIRGIFAKKTAAGFANFHPIAPGYLEYAGTYKYTEDRTLMLCTWTEAPENTFYGWTILGDQYGLVFVLRNGSSSRVLEAEFLFLNDNYPPVPECLDQKHFWKNYETNNAPTAV